MKKIYLFILLLLCTVFSQAQNKTYYVGHSLVNLDMPFIVKELCTLRGVNSDYRHHINIGTGLKQNWVDTNFNGNQIWDPNIGGNIEYGTNHYTALMAPFNNIVITESVPLTDNPIDTSAKYATLFFQYAKNYNPSIKKFIYATWEHNDMGNAAWRSALSTLKPRWESIADQVQQNLNNDSVFIVPANLAMAALYDTLQLHPIGSLSNITQFFQDDIHCTIDGNYFIACIMMASVYHADPRGLDSVQAGPYTTAISVSDPILKQKLQEIAWNTCCAYARSSLACMPTGLHENYNENNLFTIFPNPATHNIHVNIKTTNSKDALKIYNALGVCVKMISAQQQTIDISGFQKGIYWIKYGNTCSKFIVN